MELDMSEPLDDLMKQNLSSALDKLIESNSGGNGSAGWNSNLHFVAPPSTMQYQYGYG